MPPFVGVRGVSDEDRRPALIHNKLVPLFINVSSSMSTVDSSQITFLFLLLTTKSGIRIEESTTPPNEGNTVSPLNHKSTKSLTPRKTLLQNGDRTGFYSVPSLFYSQQKMIDREERFILS